MRRRLLGFLPLLLAGCSFAPHDVRPALPVPPSWPVGDAYLKQSEAALPSVSYAQVFTDLRLQQVIARALANNRDLRVAVANIAAARAQFRIQRAQQLPTIAGGPNVGVSDRGTAAGNQLNGGVRELYQVNVGISAFEIDLFGRVRSLTRAQLDTYFATEAAARATRLTLVGDLAEAWLTYAADSSLLAIAERTAALAQQSVRLTRARLEGGIAPRTDLRQAEQVRDTAEADIASAKTAKAQDANLLQLLVGAPVEGALLPASIDEAAPTLAELPAGLDSAVLLRRPDVVQAEYELYAANARIGAARAALFPRISLTGLAGLGSLTLGNLFTGGAFNWSTSAGASYNFFDGGAARGGVALARAQRDASVATYEKSIQTAFREVADALARRGTIADEEAARRRFVDAARDTEVLADARYQGGIDTFLQSLDAQRARYTAERSLVTTRLDRATNLVALYRTLGGDATLDVPATGR